jgi:hypothetical protein
MAEKSTQEKKTVNSKSEVFFPLYYNYSVQVCYQLQMYFLLFFVVGLFFGGGSCLERKIEDILVRGSFGIRLVRVASVMRWSCLLEMPWAELRILGQFASF